MPTGPIRLIVDLTGSLPRGIRDDLDNMGRYVTSPEAQELARMANQGVPQLRTHGPRGERLDVVEFHPAWHALMRRSMASGLHSSVWDPQADADAKDEAHKVAGGTFLPDGTARIRPSLPDHHDQRLRCRSLGFSKRAKGLGAEDPFAQIRFDQQARHAEISRDDRHGHDREAGRHGCALPTRRAERGRRGIYRLTGHKWFMSAPMSDAFLMLAQTKEGMGCFLVPRVAGDGSGNGLQFQRLKDKLGNRSNASSEVEFQRHVRRDARRTRCRRPHHPRHGHADAPRLRMASSGIMRASLAEAVHHARGRSVFGKMLVDQPMMSACSPTWRSMSPPPPHCRSGLRDAFDKARDQRVKRPLMPAS
jgi:putative acyl-CoA dehydrogenase